MRVEHLDLGVEFGLDLGQLDLGFGLELLMDRIGLRLGLQCQHPWIGRR